MCDRLTANFPANNFYKLHKDPLCLQQTWFYISFWDKWFQSSKSGSIKLSLTNILQDIFILHNSMMSNKLFLVYKALSNIELVLQFIGIDAVWTQNEQIVTNGKNFQDFWTCTHVQVKVIYIYITSFDMKRIS